MSEEKWGIGNAKDKEAFDTVLMGKETLDLIHGEYPHSRSDKTTYARTKDGSITGFDGHRLPFKIEIEEGNYWKSSGLSGDEIRKSCSGKLSVNGVQIFYCGGRTYDRCYKEIQKF